MLQKFLSTTSLRNFNNFSRTLSKYGSSVRCYTPIKNSLQTCVSEVKCVQRLGIRSASLQQVTKRSIINTIQRRTASTTGNHVPLWQIERVVATTFIATLPMCIMMDNKVIDLIMALTIVMHTHWGLEAIILDYARPIVVGHVVPKVAFAMLYLLSAATLAGLLMLIYEGPGIGGSVRKAWQIGKE